MNPIRKQEMYDLVAMWLDDTETTPTPNGDRFWAQDLLEALQDNDALQNALNHCHHHLTLKTEQAAQLQAKLDRALDGLRAVDHISNWHPTADETPMPHTQVIIRTPTNQHHIIRYPSPLYPTATHWRYLNS